MKTPKEAKRMEKTANNVVVRFNSDSLKRIAEMNKEDARKKFNEMCSNVV